MRFNYFARTKEGKIQSGRVEAMDRNSAIESIQKSGLFVVELNVESQVDFLNKRFAIFDKVKRKDMVSFTRQLATLVGASIPLVESLQALGKQATNSFFRETIFTIANDVEGGTVFSKALARHPKVFNDFFVNLIKSGEVSGGLSEVLNYLADHLEKEYYLISRIKGAMIYPAFVVAGFVIIGFLMLTVVVPQLTSIIMESGQELPWPTKVLIAVSDFARDWGWLFFAIVGLLAYVFTNWKKTLDGELAWDSFKLRLPILGEILKKIYLARFAENLATLIKGGLSILSSLQVASDTVGSAVYRDLIRDAKEKVKGGDTISSVFAKHPELVPAMMVEMIQTAEKTGKLEKILNNVSEFYSKEVNSIAERIPQIIEPILIIVLAMGVGVLLAAILMPIYNLAGSF